jgi:hypothetical protein
MHLKKLNLLILSVAFFSCTSAQKSIDADNPNIEYTGRIDFSNPKTPVFSFSGISIRAQFTGTSIAMKLAGDQNFFEIILDGQPLYKLKVNNTKTVYELASGLKDTIHEIEIFKCTEVLFGKSVFSGFLIDNNGSIKQPTDKREKLIEFIGNSITCGYGNEGPLGGKFSDSTENHFLTYAAITSRTFEARHLAVCRSGIGIYRNWAGPQAVNPDCMPIVYKQIFINQTKPQYKFQEKPDVICIDLGTNDFSLGKGDSALYVSNFFLFIDSLQKLNKNTDIVLLLGSMMNGDDLIKVRRYLQYIAKTSSDKGNGKVMFFEMSVQDGNLGIAIDYHPSVQQHIKNGSELIGFLHSTYGWKINPIAIQALIKSPSIIEIDFNTEIFDTTNNFKNLYIVINDVAIGIENVVKDNINKNFILLKLNKSIIPGSKVVVNYTGKTISSQDGSLLKPFTLKLN